MKKNMLKKKYLILATALLSLAACEKQPGGQGEPIPMAVEVALDGTKAGVTVGDLADFYLQVNCPSDAAYSYFVHVTKATDGSWQTDKPMFWRDETTPVTYCAAWSGLITLADLGGLQLPTSHIFTPALFADGEDMNLLKAQVHPLYFTLGDLLMLKPTTTKFSDTADGKLTIELTHALSILQIELTLGEKFYMYTSSTTANPVVELKVNSMPLTYHFTPSTGTVTPVAGSEGDIMPYPVSYTPGTATVKAAKAVYKAFVVPGTYAPGALTLSLRIGNGNYTWTNNKPIVLASGQSATLPVSVATPYFYYSLINIDPDLASVDMGEVTIGGVTKHLKWATCNMGAEHPWDYGGYYAWGAILPQTKYDFEDSPFMQTGKNSWEYYTKYTIADGQTEAIWYDGYGQFIGDGKTSFADYLYVDDAARQIWGGSWRIPTDDEWSALRDTEKYSWEWKTNYNGSGKNGMLVTRKEGTGPCAGNSIFLPAAGYHALSAGSIDGEGTYGYYWSSSLAPSNSQGAMSTKFSSGGVGHTNSLRRTGCSIRPVTD